MKNSENPLILQTEELRNYHRKHSVLYYEVFPQWHIVKMVPSGMYCIAFLVKEMTREKKEREE